VVFVADRRRRRLSVVCDVMYCG